MFGISSYAFTRPSKIQSNKLNCKKSVNIYCFRFAWSKLRYAKKQGKILFHTKRPEEKLKLNKLGQWWGFISPATISWQIHRVLYSGIRLVMADLWRFLVAMLSRFLFIFTQVTKAQPTRIVELSSNVISK